MTIDTAELDATEAPEIVIEAEADGETPEAESPAIDEGDEDEVIVSIGDTPAPQEEAERAPEWVRELRKTNREQAKRIKELEAKSTTEEKPVTLGAKPTLEQCDFDSEKFEAELDAWHVRKREVEAAEASAKAKRDAEAAAWQDRLDSYTKAKTSLRVKDFEDAESFAMETFSVTQQGIVIQGAENPALVIYALGKNPQQAKELAAVNDPVKFAFAVAKLETQLKVSNRKAPPPPEKTVTGNGGAAGAMDATLERLRAEAERTGDYTKVTQYKRQKRAA